MAAFTAATYVNFANPVGGSEWAFQGLLCTDAPLAINSREGETGLTTGVLVRFQRSATARMLLFSQEGHTNTWRCRAALLIDAQVHPRSSVNLPVANHQPSIPNAVSGLQGAGAWRARASTGVWIRSIATVPKIIHVRATEGEFWGVRCPPTGLAS